MYRIVTLAPRVRTLTRGTLDHQQHFLVARALIAVVALFTLTTAPTAFGADSAQKPNIIIIMADDK